MLRILTAQVRTFPISFQTKRPRNVVYLTNRHYIVYFLTIKLILDDVVEDLEQEEDEMVVLLRGEEEPGGGESLQEVE